MAQIRNTNLSRAEVDTVDEVQRVFNDVYRILREQQQEIGKPAPKPEPDKVNAQKKNNSKKESDK